jgi:hypothetical protein
MLVGQSRLGQQDLERAMTSRSTFQEGVFVVHLTFAQRMLQLVKIILSPTTCS